MKNWQPIAVTPRIPLQTAIGPLNKAVRGTVFAPEVNDVLSVAGGGRAAGSLPRAADAGHPWCTGRH